jgi:uracil-DNA glycosylase
VSDARKRTDDDATTSLDANGPGDPGVVTHAHVGGFVGSLALEEQGGEAWHALRASRLTASAFGNALGFWRGGRVSLWEEKLGLAAPFAGNDATEWGTAREDEAVEAYKRLTGADVSHMLFRVLSPDEAELWLGASPDGLVAGAATKDAESAESDESDDASSSSSPPGVLEIKCPWNKGDPLNAVPYPRVPWYYVPQVQGLMAVFDRPYCDVFCYTARNGAAIYRVRRDAAYWTAMYAGLSDFWWQHVVPGKHALAAGEDPERHRPGETHALTEDMKRWSRRIAESAAQRRFSAAETDAGEGARPFA